MAASVLRSPARPIIGERQRGSRNTGSLSTVGARLIESMCEPFVFFGIDPVVSIVPAANSKRERSGQTQILANLPKRIGIAAESPAAPTSNPAISSLSRNLSLHTGIVIDGNLREPKREISPRRSKLPIAHIPRSRSLATFWRLLGLVPYGPSSWVQWCDYTIDSAQPAPLTVRRILLPTTTAAA